MPYATKQGQSSTETQRHMSVNIYANALMETPLNRSRNQDEQNDGDTLIAKFMADTFRKLREIRDTHV